MGLADALPQPAQSQQPPSTTTGGSPAVQGGTGLPVSSVLPGTPPTPPQGGLVVITCGSPFRLSLQAQDPCLDPQGHERCTALDQMLAAMSEAQLALLSRGAPPLLRLHMQVLM
jgi:hypothetical protein